CSPGSKQRSWARLVQSSGRYPDSVEKEPTRGIDPGGLPEGAGSRRGAAWGITVVFVAAVLAALTTVGHGLAGATRVFGLYQPAFHASSWHIGPLLNPNNLAGYLNLGALSGLGLMQARKPRIPAWL